VKTVKIYTSSRAASLKKVSYTIAQVLESKKIAAAEVEGSPSLDGVWAPSFDAALIVMSFDPVWAIPYMYLAWRLKYEGIPVAFYTVCEGRPELPATRSWVKRDLEFVVPSRFVERMLKREGVKVVGIVPHGVFVDEILAKAHTRKGVREALGLRNKFVVSYVASASKRKGHAIFAEVVRQVEQKDPSVQFVIVTEPQAAPLYKGTRALVLTEFGNLFEFDIDQVYHASDLYVHPSLSEGFGLPVLEALAAGRPVVHPDYEPLTEITTDEVSFRVPVSRIEYDRPTETGIHYELKFYDPTEFAEAILQAKDAVLRDRKSGFNLVRAAVERAREFDAYKLYSAFRSLVA